jgi:uncharacterized protein (DUF1810 family)
MIYTGGGGIFMEVFQKVLDKFYGGERDERTIELLG